MPAYDRFIQEGLKIDGKENNIQIKRNFNTKDIKKCEEDVKKSIEGICNTYSKEESQFRPLKYPIMRLLDMYLFEKGLEKYNTEKNNKKNNK